MRRLDGVLGGVGGRQLFLLVVVVVVVVAAAAVFDLGGVKERRFWFSVTHPLTHSKTSHERESEYAH